MSDPKSSEIWQVEVSGQVYEADFAELAAWVTEGALQPDDKVRRGNLRWIEARKVPPLVPFFNAKASGTAPPPIVISTTVAEEPAAVEPVVSATVVNPDMGVVVPELTVTMKEPTVVTATVAPIQPTTPVPSTAGRDVCANHYDRAAINMCSSCGLLLCRDCVRSFGTSVMVCAVCGGMCKKITEVESAKQSTEFRTAAITKGFGFGDFSDALAYPFKFKASLFFGAVLFMFFSLGKGAASMGGLYMIAAAIFCYMLANMLTFGILSNTVESFAHGKIGKNFMPSFDDFSLWDSVVHPFFLSIGAYIASFGPFVAVFALGSYMVMSSVTSQNNAVKDQVAQTPGTPYYSGVKDVIDQSNQVKSVLGNSNRINQQRLDQEQNIEEGNTAGAPLADQQEDRFEDLNKTIADSKRKELESVVGKSAETRQQESEQFMSGLLRLAAPLVILGFIAFLWGAFYFPAACMVAGYTQTFAAAINPLVGLDTIKRLGFDYVKILFMGLMLVIAWVMLGVVLSLIFAPFDIPGLGNVPVKAIGSLFEFYLWIVFPCVLGFALFKASDRMRLAN